MIFVLKLELQAGIEPSVGFLQITIPEATVGLQITKGEPVIIPNLHNFKV